MTIGKTSGTYLFNPATSDLVLEAFDRCGIRPTSLSREQLRSAYRSCNLALSTWSNRGVNLWEVDLLSIPLTQGQISYGLPTNTAQVWDVYIRQYQLGSTVNLPCLFSTTLGSSSVTVTWPANGLSVGAWVSFVVPVSIGGLIVQGYYQITSVISGDTFTINATGNAAATASGGATPVFTSTAGSSTINVNLANHGLLSGYPFNVQISTVVSDVVLFGVFNVVSVIDANNFTITGPNAANTSTSTSENGGNFQIAGQSTTGAPTDRLLYPLSRTDYASIPNKTTQGTVNTFWFDRLSPSPQMYLWQVPNGSVISTLQVYRTKRVQDASLQDGQTLDIPYRFLEAFTSDIAARFAQKFTPALWPTMQAEAKMQWAEAAHADEEKVSMYLVPSMQDYFNG